MTTIDNEDQIRSALSSWAEQGLLQSAKLGENGLTLDDTTLANIPLTVNSGEKSCQYTMTSIYLQLIHSTKVIDYRNACKKYKVSDPVKTLDKSIILGYFPASSSTAAADTSAAAAAPPAVAAATAEDEEAPLIDEKRKRKEHRKKEKSSSSSKHKDKHHRSSGSKPQPPPKKKPKVVTNEELLSNLNVVVDKRQPILENAITDADIVANALSADGFDVTPELLEEHKAKTERILANEIPMGDSISILRATNPRRNFARVLELFQETQPAPPPPKRSGSKARPPPPPPKPLKQAKTYLHGKNPVIVVPKGMTAPITMANAYYFLSDAKYVPRLSAIKQAGSRKFTNTIKRIPNIIGQSGTASNIVSMAGKEGSQIEYEIVDNPKTKFGMDPKEWDRIVAVVVLGQAWQFKDWYKEWSNPTYLFANSFGIYICMEGDKVPPEIGQWSVTQARLNRDKRGLDSITYATFWNGLDEFMSVHKRDLLPQINL